MKKTYITIKLADDKYGNSCNWQDTVEAENEDEAMALFNKKHQSYFKFDWNKWKVDLLENFHKYCK